MFVFYKSPSNTGIHIGNLWSVTGTNLAQATFINETASGWQEVLFGNPVQITAGTTYIASYHTTTATILKIIIILDQQVITRIILKPCRTIQSIQTVCMQLHLT